jgi:hypothetical protein
MLPWGLLAASGAGAAGSYELIATALVSTTGNVTFSSIPATYRHLQIRVTGRATSNRGCFLYFNNDFATAAASHDLRGNGSSVTSSSYTGQVGPGVQDMYSLSTDTANQFGAAIIDILDYAQTTKNKVVRFLGGHTSSGGSRINLASGVWISTSAVTQILVTGGNGFEAGSRVSLYGVKG